MKNKSIRVSAPGKIHFLGEHTVVYGKPALIAAIDKRCSIGFTSRDDTNVEILSKNFGISKTLSIKKIIEKTKEARNVWRTFIKKKDVSYLTSITQNPLDYPFLAVGQSLLNYSSSEAKGEVEKNGSRRASLARTIKKGFTVEIDSEIPVGSGCGSSSAIAVTIAGAVWLYQQKSRDDSGQARMTKIDDLNKQRIFETAIRIEEFKHGTPSGGDPATVLHGGFVWFEKKGDEKQIKPLDISISNQIAKRFFLIHTGKPEESTGEMIAQVREYMENNPHRAKKIFDEQEKLVRELVEAVKKNDNTLMIRIIKVGEQNLEKLGVVSPFVQKIIREIESAGGAAKISGGGGKQEGTGMVLCYIKNKLEVERICKKLRMDCFQTKLGVEGLRVDEM